MKKGFTLPEVIVAIAFFGLLVGLVTISLFNARGQTAQGATVDVLIADLKEQQIKAMSGSGDLDYGIYLEAGKYTLFDGNTYTPGASSNFEIALDPSIAISNILFPNSIIVFQKGSGEILNFVSGQNTFIVNLTTGGNPRTVSLNRLGAVDQSQ